MKYKVGDKVRIKPKYYFCSVDGFKNIHMKDEFFNQYSRLPYCETVMTIGIVNEDFYILKEDRWAYKWTDEMIEGLVEEEIKPEPKFKIGDKVILDSYPCKVTDVHWRDSLHGFVYIVRGVDFAVTALEDNLVFDERLTPTTDEIIRLIKNDWNNFKDRYDIPDDYHFVDKNGNEINISDVVLKKKKKEYPKTYEECCYVLGFENTELVFEDDYRNINPPKEQWKRLGLINQFNKLLICRDTYWKIAGEEMGLGKSWKPNFTQGSGIKYSILFANGELIWNRPECVCTTGSRILVFPTVEMRDAFYENFKEKIEFCKELL